MNQTKGKYRSMWRTGRETDQLSDQHNSEQAADQATDRLIAAINQVAEKINNAAERVETALVASRVERASDVVKQIRYSILDFNASSSSLVVTLKYTMYFRMHLP